MSLSISSTSSTIIPADLPIKDSTVRVSQELVAAMTEDFTAELGQIIPPKRADELTEIAKRALSNLQQGTLDPTSQFTNIVLFANFGPALSKNVSLSACLAEDNKRYQGGLMPKQSETDFIVSDCRPVVAMVVQKMEKLRALLSPKGQAEWPQTPEEGRAKYLEKSGLNFYCLDQNLAVPVLKNHAFEPSLGEEILLSKMIHRAIALYLQYVASESFFGDQNSATRQFIYEERTKIHGKNFKDWAWEPANLEINPGELFDNLMTFMCSEFPSLNLNGAYSKEELIAMAVSLSKCGAVVPGLDAKTRTKAQVFNDVLFLSVLLIKGDVKALWDANVGRVFKQGDTKASSVEALREFLLSPTQPQPQL